MRLFSEREGFVKPREVIQEDDIDSDLRTQLWNILSITIWKRSPVHIDMNTEISTFINSLWMYFLKRPLDTLDNYFKIPYKEIRQYFFECEWYKVYDFLEFVSENFPSNEQFNEKTFKEFCDSILKQELSAYRFLGNKIAKITSKEEINEIEEALETPLKPINVHIEKSLNFLFDKKNPDYRNSIKESISAVEALCKIITKNNKATLGNALNQIEKSGQIKLHMALKSAFSKLYGYTSDEGGIRHALMEEDKVEFEDAKFMLVSCSAFINYLLLKSSKSNVDI